MPRGRWRWVAGVLALGLLPAGWGSATVRVGTYNLENYVESATSARPAKSALAHAKVRESIHALDADILALQEIGATNVLLELRATLKSEGLDYPYWEHVRGHDTNIFVAVLSRFPIVARRPHERESYLLRGRRFQVSRGFAEVDVQVAPHYLLTVICAHLKSRRPSAAADEAEMREQEALLLRERIDALLAANPQANLVVAADLNDTKDSPAVKAVLGRGARALLDTRPAERNGDPPPDPGERLVPRNVTWTHFYAREDAYERVDYLLASPGLAREWDRTGTWVLSLAGWGLASDHRPVVAAFQAEDR